MQATEYIRSDNGPEFVAQKLRDRLASVDIQTAYIEPGSPPRNGFVESFNTRMRDEFLNTARFDTYKETKILKKMWVDKYNTIRPHGSLGYKPPTYQAVVT